MNKKQQSPKKGKRQAAAALAVCFVAVVALTGVYTWNHSRELAQEELARAEEELAAKQEETGAAAEEANAAAEKAEEEAEDSSDQELEVQEQEEAPAEEDENETGTSSGTQTAGTASQVNFTEDSQLLWPVDGNVIMSYSMDQTVYFKTLDQYKYNPAVILSGSENDSVISAAPGIIKSIDVQTQTGTTITVDMGNGYECIYGQLKDVQVKTGDYVEAGTLLGYLSEPTKYYSLEGCNLYFAMKCDGQPVNPMDYMAAEEDE